MSLNPQKLKIEIPEINPQNFEEECINDVPRINKDSIKRAKFHFWLNNNEKTENIENNTNVNEIKKCEKK